MSKTLAGLAWLRKVIITTAPTKVNEYATKHQNEISKDIILNLFLKDFNKRRKVQSVMSMT